MSGDAFSDALHRCNALADELSAAGVRFRITIDDGEGLTAELQSADRPRRPR